ncbi:MAG TPA: Uma2 family endonuclease [Gemmataceae bacterium]|nr:Uma2 family endonuclease [Gemmataceae bacterium]
MIVRTAKTPATIYPDSDGQPMGETPRHVRTILDSYEILDYWFRNRADVFVAANMFLYYVRGDRHKHVSPDVFVVKGIPKIKIPERRSYRLWEEGKAPSAAIEVTSTTTWDEDADDKFNLYQDVLHINEYFLFDPYAENLKTGLAGYRLARGKYQEIKPVQGRLPSKMLELHLENDHGNLRFFDPAAREYVQSSREARAEMDRLKKELKKVRGETE